ncbi:MAG TPA: thiamine pyrophosphate-dependent dehydrogenase E1 component subunit alpha [Candidatus Acidoferrales bacterium]|nr:thiamine pyrophosphate-dependent dehydrogenase E1 component subunit alpha [Candidatus Acidoferrales bacterium]
MYRKMLLARAIDRRMWALNRQGKASFVVSAQGHEAAQVGAAAAMRPGVDWLVPYYRDLAFCIALGVTPLDFMLSVFARATDPSSGGRQMPSHFSNPVAHIVSTSSVVGPKQLHACGLAYAARLRGLDEVAVSCIGEGGTSQGDWHEAMNFAAIHRLPFICLVQDNGYAISVPHQLQMGVESVAARAAGYGMPGISVDGGDILEVYAAMTQAMTRARSGEGPTLIAAKVDRFTSHSSDDDQRRYRPSEELEAMLQNDPLERFAKYLLEHQLMSPEDDKSLHQECAAAVDEAVAAAETAPSPDPAQIHRHLFFEEGSR